LSLDAKYREAYGVVKEICDFFRIPPPPIVFERDGLGRFEDGVIYLSPDLSGDLLYAVAAHEAAHASHVYYGIPCPTPECEAYAEMFEKVWLAKHRGQSIRYSRCVRCGYPVLLNYGGCLRCGGMLKCSRCGGVVYTYGDKAVCSRCGATYVKQSTVYRHPQLAVATLTLNLTGAYRFGAFGIAKEGSNPLTDFVVGYHHTWPLCLDPPGYGDTSDRSFTFKTSDTIRVFGKLFTDSTPVGGALVRIKLEGPTPIDKTVTTGALCGEFSLRIEPNKLLPGAYKVTLIYG